MSSCMTSCTCGRTVGHSPRDTTGYRRSNARSSRGVTRALLFSKAILRAEFAADAPLREAMAIKRQRLQALRAKRVAKKANDASRREHRALAIKRKRLRTKRAAEEAADARDR